MSLEGKKCLELVLHDGSNYESWCIYILHNIKSFNPYLLNIVDASICPPNINWVNLSEEEGKCLKLNAQSICLLAQSLSPNVEAIIIKEHRFPMDAHLLWIYINDMFSDTTSAQDSRGSGCLIKSIRLVRKPDGLAKSTGSRLPKGKRFACHVKCLMAKGKKKKKPTKDEREEEEDKEEEKEEDKY
jgi:hypothetical protein